MNVGNPYVPERPRIRYVSLKNEHLHMHSSTQISHAGIIFHADQNLKCDFRDFDFLLFLGIKSESNQYLAIVKMTITSTNVPTGQGYLSYVN